MRTTESRIRWIIREEAHRILNEGADEDKVRRSLSVVQNALRNYGAPANIPNIDGDLADAIEGAADADLVYERFNEIRGVALFLVGKLRSAQAVLLAEERGDIEIRPQSRRD